MKALVNEDVVEQDIPVKHPGLGGIERIYKGAGSVSQGIGNVPWLKPLPSSWPQSSALSLLVVW